MFLSIYRQLTDILGDSKQGGYDSNAVQYQFCCPNCAEENGGMPDNKFNLEVLLSPKRMAFHCWRCGDYSGMKGNLSRLFRRYGSPEQYMEYKNEVDELVKSKMYDINAYANEMRSESIGEVMLPESFKKIDTSTLKDRWLREYLEKRRITQDIIDKFNIGYTDRSDPEYMMRNRIVIPSYDSYGELAYWVARDYSGRSRVKYKNCLAEKKEIIFQESLIDPDADIVLCEGAIDCLYVDNCISMLGKILINNCKLHQYLLSKARGKIFICLDSDTDLSETKDIYRKLNRGRLKGQIWYIRMKEYKDFGELYEAKGKLGIIEALRSAKQFTEVDLAFY